MSSKNIKPSEQVSIPGIVITVALILLISFLIDMTALKGYVMAAGMWGPLIFIFLKILTIVVAPLSGSPLYPLVGLLFGFWPGVLYAVIGDFLGYTVAFMISRKFGTPVVRRFISGKEHGLLARIVEHVGTTKGFLHVCLTCFAAPELIAYGVGLGRLQYWKFISIFMPVSTLATAVLVLLGSHLDFQNRPLLLTAGVLGLGFLAMGIGGYFFYRGIKE